MFCSNSLYKTDKFSKKLKNLTDSLKDSSNNLKSIDYLLNPSQKYSNEFNQINSENNFQKFNKSIENLKDTTKSINKIESSLENISINQDRMETEIKRMHESNLRHNSDIPKKAASINNLDLRGYKHDDRLEASINVDNKLKEAQQKLRNERALLENRNSASTKSIDLSSDLKAALIGHTQSQNTLQQVDKEQMDILQQRVVKAESENSTFKFEIKTLKLQLLNESGAKNSLLSKLESCQTTIGDLQVEVGMLRKQLEMTTVECDINRKKADVNIKLHEGLSLLQRENEQLKININQCSHLSEIGELRKQKEKTERKQSSLQDQLAEIMKQIDSKQAHINRLMDEVRELQEQSSKSKSTYHDLEQRFHENQNELRNACQINKEALDKIVDLEHAIIEIDTDKNKGFLIRDDEIERLENQSGRFKNEIEKMNVHIQESLTFNNDLHNDNELLRTQLTTANFQIDALRKEMESLLKARSIQDEMLKRRENDNENYHNENGDLKVQLEVEEKSVEKYKYDAEVYSHELSQARETIAVQEERITSLTDLNLDLKEEVTLSKSEISNLKSKVGKLENQINFMNRQIAEYNQQEENIDTLKRKLVESQHLYEKSNNDNINKTKKLDSEKNNHIKKLEQLLEAERAAAKVLLTKSNRQILEINRLHQEYWNREQSVQEYKKKYAKVKDDMEHLIKQEAIEKDHLQNTLKEEIIEREQDLSMLEDKYKELKEERDQMFRWIISDLSGVVELLCQIDVLSTQNNQLKFSNYLLTNQSIDLKSCPQSSSALSTLGGLDISKSFIDIKTKVSWIRSEVNLLCNHSNNQKQINQEMEEEMNVLNERLKVMEDDKSVSRDVELEEARQCISKLKIREKNEINLQVKCDRLQAELHQVRQYLNATLGEHFHRTSNY